MSHTKPLEKVAIVGATGRIGGYFAEALLKTGRHTITGITRAGSKRSLAEGIKRIPVDYDDHEALVSALKGQQFLVITLGVPGPEIHGNILKAAVEAGVSYVMPNMFGSDILNDNLMDDSLVGKPISDRMAQVKDLGATYVVMVCGFWYEWSLALGEQWYGFDIKKRTATFIDDGKTLINTSTWNQCGSAFAALLSLPESGTSPSLSDFKNKPLYVSSFQISQRDMLDSLNRVLGITDKAWIITHEPSAQRYRAGIEEMQKGQPTGYAKAAYTLHFYPGTHNGNYEATRELDNEKLGLPKEDLDEATKRAVEMVESGWTPFS